MKTVKITRALGLGMTAALVSTAFSCAAASAAPTTPAVPASLVATSHDGDVFELADYAAGDITVQAFDASPAAVDVVDSQDLAYSWTVTPFDASAPTVQVPVNGTDVQATDVAGRFVVPLPVAQGAGTYELTAGLTADTSGANAVPVAPLLTVKTGNAAPEGSTAEITPLGDGTPGQALDGTLTVTAPGDVPVAGQVFTLTTDHGFFTTGDSAVQPVAGAMAGDLEQLGTRLTALTDADGQIDFTVGIARDKGFDDDAEVTATVSLAGDLAATSTAAWDTANPLNGKVDLPLAPKGEQENPVNPALAGNKSIFDVFARDQFGNPVDDISMELGYSGYLKDYEYSDDDTVSDLDTFGDIWVISNVAGQIDVTATWQDAPTYRYVDATGATVSDTTDVTGTAAAKTYEIAFGSSKFSIRSSASDTVRVGTAVTHTVRVIDQQGNPVEGYQVRFLRYGPDAVRGDVVATRTTNALGEASYTFIGTKRGRATITAEVTDGNRTRQLTGTADFGTYVEARLVRVKGTDKRRSAADRLAVTATPLAAGAKVQVYRLVDGKQRWVGSKRLSSKGTVSFKVRDLNRSKRTTYVAVVRSTRTSVADQSNTVTTR